MTAIYGGVRLTPDNWLTGSWAWISVPSVKTLIWVSEPNSSISPDDPDLQQGKNIGVSVYI